MIEDLFEVENVCNKIGLIIDPGIKNMYEILCNNQKFSALTEIHLSITWNKINSYYDSYPTESPPIMSQNFSFNNHIVNYYGGYHHNYNYVCEYTYTYCIYFLHHTTLMPIYKIEIETNPNFTDEEIYDIHTYKKPKERNVWEYNGPWNSIQITYSDKNDLKEIIQQKFELLMQDD